MASDMSVPYSSPVTPPGLLRISASALELARGFLAQVRKVDGSKDWVISFDWADSRSVREKEGDEWRDIEPGLDLAAYELGDFQADDIQQIGDIQLVVKIPPEVWQHAKDRLIDTDEQAFSGIVLR